MVYRREYNIFGNDSREFSPFSIPFRRPCVRGKLVVAASGPGKRSSFRPRNCFPVKRLWIDRGKECSSTGMDTANTKKGSVSGGLWICDFFRGLIWPEIPGLRDTNYSISVSSNGIEKGSRYIVLRDISLNYKKKKKNLSREKHPRHVTDISEFSCARSKSFRNSRSLFARRES